jgi:hypothetical protein
VDRWPVTDRRTGRGQVCRGARSCR